MEAGWSDASAGRAAWPEVDVLEGLTTAIAVGQERMGANARSTVGTATDANAVLRIKMIRHLGSSLTDLTYVFDEPTTGMHPHDIQRMNDLLLRLRDKGNTVLVVEHEPETIALADHVAARSTLTGEHLAAYVGT